MTDEVQPELIDLPMPIETERLTIRPYARDDAAALSDAINASLEHLRPWMIWAQDEQTVEQSLSVIANMQSDWAIRRDLCLGIFDRGTGVVLGGSGLHRMDWTARTFEIGYWIRANAEGKGLVTEWVRALTDYAFDTLAARRVEIRMDSRNVRSRAVPIRLGFAREGVLRRAGTARDGSPRDTEVFSMIRSDRVPPAPVA